MTITSDSTLTFDGALERVTPLEFAPPLPYTSHAPMAMESLVGLGRADALGAWVPHYEAQLAAGPVPVTCEDPAAFDWPAALGRSKRRGEWIGFFQARIADQGWAPVVGEWVPRLTPGLPTALFHGVIRTAHAARALDRADTPARRDELAHALALWAGRFYRGAEPAQSVEPVSNGEIRAAVLDAAADGAGCYLVDGDFAFLHGVTGAVAVARLCDHLEPADARRALAQLRADHAALYGRTDPVAVGGRPSGFDDEAVEAAVAGFDAHEAKLVDSCKEAFAETQDPVFVAAARLVTGIG